MIQIRRIRRTTDSGSSGVSSNSAERINGLVEVGVAIGEAEVVALADLDLVGRVENGGPADELADRSLAAARHCRAERPPTVPGMPVKTSRPPRPARAECEIKAVSGTAAPASTMLSRTVRSEKNGLSRWITRAFDPLVANQDVGPAAQDLECDPFLPAPLQQGDQLVELARIGKIRGRSTQTEPDQGSQRLVEFHGPAEVVEYVHRLGFPTCKTPLADIRSTSST